MENDTLLARWLANELSGQELAALQSRPDYPTLEKIRHRFERLERPQFDKAALLQSVLTHEKKKPVIPFYRRNVLRLSIAAVVVIALGIVFLLPSARISGRHQQLAFSLPDQSEVILNSASKLTYSRWDWVANRNVTLEGEAFFKVAKGKKFTVRTSVGEVSVFGTRFNVRQRGTRLEVECFEGKVGVRSTAGSQVLTPGMRYVVEDSGQAAVSGMVDAEPRWMHAQLAFSQQRLTEVIEEIERAYDVSIRCELTTEQLFTGVLPADDLDAALRIIALTYHLSVDAKDGHFVLKP